MEVTSGQAVEYEEAGQLRWAVVETVGSNQVQQDHWHGKELVLACNYPSPSSGQSEVYLTSRPAHNHKATIRQVCPLLELRVWARERKGFLWRRKFKPDTGVFDPATLPLTCTCPLPINPDQPFVACENCPAVLHINCLVGSQCPKCGLVLSVKRPAPPIPETPQVKTVKTDRSIILQISKYSLLNPLAACDLERTLQKLAEESAKAISSLSQTDQVRQNLRDKVLAALLLSRAEQRSQDTLLDTPHLSTLSALSREVEAALFFSSKESINTTNYRNRARMLVFNLQDEKNPDLRANVMKGEITPHALVYMDSKDMASGCMKRTREMRERKYLEEQLIKQEDEEAQEARNGKKKEEEVENGKDGDILPIPYLRSDSSCSRLHELAAENSPAVLGAKIRKRLKQYLLPDQVRAVLEAAEIDYT